MLKSTSLVLRALIIYQRLVNEFSYEMYGVWYSEDIYQEKQIWI